EFRPELKSAIYALELDSLAIDLALSRRYPDIILTGSYEQLGVEDLNDVNKQISLAVRLPIPYNVATQTAQRKAEQKQSSLRRAAIEDKIRVQVAESYANMVFWQNEATARQATWQEVQKLLSQAENSSRADLSALEALHAYYQTGRDYYEGIRQNLSSKASLEWAIGRDL
ncbi:MAG: TolC family protein, partial [Elusimicrobiaceae bacterium]|nr:TolC family protein [Elusimicrobiaceae bacterium]